ncbi:MAG TPA: hypothetical protein EYG82_01780 [Sulfurovum sp.]|nr:hypothetical protein [Sulfurovum sp.]
MLKIKEFFYLSITGVFIIGCNPSDTATEIAVAGTNGQTIAEDTTVLPKRTLSEEKASNWYVRLVASDASKNIRSGDTMLGVLDEENAVQKHTLEASATPANDYIDIIFRDPAGVAAGDYKTNFQQYIDNNSEHRWSFVVKTDDSNAQIALTWRGIYVLNPYIDDQDRQRYNETRSMTNPVIKNMQLIDVDTGNVINTLSGNKAKVYYFSMNGQTEKRFEWVMIPDSALPVGGVK